MPTIQQTSKNPVLEAFIRAKLGKGKERLTFELNQESDDIRLEETSTGNIAWKVKTEQGKTIKFWGSMMDDVLDVLDNGKLAVKLATRIEKNGWLFPKRKNDKDIFGE